jgi:hypothetical protein
MLNRYIAEFNSKFYLLHKIKVKMVRFRDMCFCALQLEKRQNLCCLEKSGIKMEFLKVHFRILNWFLES